MAQTTKSPEMAVLEAKHTIFNKLCVAYRRTHQDPAFGIRADEVRIELGIPENVFAAALSTFVGLNKRSNDRCGV